MRDARRSHKLPSPAATGSGQVRWRDIAITAYGPTILIAVGQGAILPLVALSARELGASVGMAAFIVALIGIGQLVGDLPAGVLAARIGEKRALITACALDAVALLGAFLAESVALLAIAITVTGIAGAVFSLARQAYLTEAIPIPMRARALSTLGGTFRIGLFIGPFIAAAIVTRWTIGAAYGFAAVMSVAAAVLTAFLPDVTTSRRTSGQPRRPATQISDLGATRASQGTADAWSRHFDHLGGTRDASVDRAALGPVDRPERRDDQRDLRHLGGSRHVAVYPGGAIMDRFGRVYVAVPSMIVLGLGFLSSPLTSGATSVGFVAALMGLGNGISSGVILTLGADASPSQDRAQFLGGWRVCSDLGNAAGPLVVSAVSALATLAAAAVTMGLLTWAGSAWLIKWVPVYAPGRRHQQRREAREP